MIYSLSLFKNNITRHTEWAYQQLKENGYIIIADVDRRFPKGFQNAMKETGFHCRVNSKTDSFSVWLFRKEIRPALYSVPTVTLDPF